MKNGLLNVPSRALLSVGYSIDGWFCRAAVAGTNSCCCCAAFNQEIIAAAATAAARSHLINMQFAYFLLSSKWFLLCNIFTFHSLPPLPPLIVLLLLWSRICHFCWHNDFGAMSEIWHSIFSLRIKGIAIKINFIWRMHFSLVASVVMVGAVMVMPQNSKWKWWFALPWSVTSVANWVQ